MNILITGANGQLGAEFRELIEKKTDHTFFFEDSFGLDITNKAKVLSYVTKKQINAVINCAAYTAVDKAESEPLKAEEVNSLGVKNLIEALSNVDGKLIHFSTDYVFNGKNYKPYLEKDFTEPIGVYGETKRKGEEFLLNSPIEAIIIRTSWVYSTYGSNFVKTILKLAKERDELRIIFDQIGTPTYARDLAVASLDILLREGRIDKVSKIYHFSNEGVASWYDFAKAIVEISSINCKINPIETKDYPTPTKRPNYSLLNKGKIKSDFKMEIPYWRDSLKECILKLQNS